MIILSLWQETVSVSLSLWTAPVVEANIFPLTEKSETDEMQEKGSESESRTQERRV